MWRWKQLSDAGTAALKKWRLNNPTKPGATWTDEFWMTAEVFGLGVGVNNYHTNGGFDSTINFGFQIEPSYMNQIDETYSQYAKLINGDPSKNALSYISSHDTSLYDRKNLYNGGTALLLAPGGVQIFYGDETARQLGQSGSDKDQGTRSAMNWNAFSPKLLAHWQKLGTFRNNHRAIGAGSHQKLADAPYTFARTYNKNGIKDQVIVVLGGKGNVTVRTTGVFADGTIVRDHYTNRIATVSAGKLTIQTGTTGVTLLEEVAKNDARLKLPAPTNVAFQNGASGAKVSWKAVANAKGYRVYVNSELVGKTTSETSFTLNAAAWKKGQSQQIEVSAMHSNGESMLSKVVLATIPQDVIKIAGKQIVVNGKALPVSAQPQTINGSMYVPFKSIFTSLGVYATWNNKTKTLTASKPNFNLVMTLNANSAKLNGKTIKLDATIKMIGGSVYVPLRFVGNSLDALIQYSVK
jgi:hypothetical protein